MAKEKEYQKDDFRISDLGALTSKGQVANIQVSRGTGQPLTIAGQKPSINFLIGQMHKLSHDEQIFAIALMTDRFDVNIQELAKKKFQIQEEHRIREAEKKQKTRENEQAKQIEPYQVFSKFYEFNFGSSEDKKIAMTTYKAMDVKSLNFLLEKVQSYDPPSIPRHFVQEKASLINWLQTIRNDKNAKETQPKKHFWES